MVVAVLQRGLFVVQDVAAGADGRGEGGDDRADGRLADLAAVAAPGVLAAVAVEQVAVRRDAQREDDLVELLAGLREAAAQPLVDLDAGRLQLGGDELAEHLEATAAARSGLGAGLHLGHGGAVVLGDGGADCALGHVVAGTDDRFVRKGRGAQLDGTARPGGKDQLFRRDGRDRTGQRAQCAVRLGVADQDAAEQGAVAADDELLVETGAGVGVDDVQAVVGGAVRVAEGRHVDTEQLELGGHVGAGEGRLVLGDGRGGRQRLLVAGRDQAVDLPVGGQRALADGEDALVGEGAALFVDGDATAFADGETAVPGELVTGPDAGAEHHHVGGQHGPVGQLHAGDPAGAVGDDLLGAHARVDAEPHALDGAQQCRAAAVVDLHRHQPRGELHDVGDEPEPLQRARGLQAEQPAADHRTGPGLRFRVLLDGEDVVDGAVDEAALRVLARDRRYEGVGAGGQHQDVVGEDLPGAGGDGPRVTVDALGRVPDTQLDAVLRDERHVRQGQFLGLAAGEVRGQMHTVVGGARLLAQHDHAVRTGQAAFGERFEEALADHAVADEHDGGAGEIPCGRGRRHQEPPSLVSRWSRGPVSGSDSAPSQARASTPTVPSAPTRTPPTRRSSRTTTLR